MNPANQFILSAVQLLPRPVVNWFAMRCITGGQLDDAVRVVKGINSIQMMGTIDVPGENVSTREESLAAVREYEEVLHSINKHNLRANPSIELTLFGLKIDQEFCYSNVKGLRDITSKYNHSVRIDMEDSSTTSETLG